jgi:hypothetical protein
MWPDHQIRSMDFSSRHAELFPLISPAAFSAHIEPLLHAVMAVPVPEGASIRTGSGRGNA